MHGRGVSGAAWGTGYDTYDGEVGGKACCSCRLRDAGEIVLAGATAGQCDCSASFAEYGSAADCAGIGLGRYWHRSSPGSAGGGRGGVIRTLYVQAVSVNPPQWKW